MTNPKIWITNQGSAGESYPGWPSGTSPNFLPGQGDNVDNSHWFLVGFGENNTTD